VNLSEKKKTGKKKILRVENRTPDEAVYYGKEYNKVAV